MKVLLKLYGVSLLRVTNKACSLSTCLRSWGTRITFLVAIFFQGQEQRKVTMSNYMTFFPLGNEAINKVSMGGIWELKDGEKYLMCTSSRTSKGTIRRA